MNSSQRSGRSLNLVHSHLSSRGMKLLEGRPMSTLAREAILRSTRPFATRRVLWARMLVRARIVVSLGLVSLSAVAAARLSYWEVDTQWQTWHFMALMTDAPIISIHFVILL